ncbi:hypothetical protein ACIQ00_11575 [Micrococcus luteus]|uniref:hypothetical protein n=1 Tax=Micrococcus luteus TaxID=1270 RepID=UPI0019111AE1|nr:hypothetical protein I6H91_06375 [Micrococcus luteus]
MHALLRRQGWMIGRDQIGRLMRIAGVHGVKRTKKVFTTKPDLTSEKPRVKRPGFRSDPTEGESEHAQEVHPRAA